jgi:hypothetical protein
MRGLVEWVLPHKSARRDSRDRGEKQSRREGKFPAKVKETVKLFEDIKHPADRILNAFFCPSG